MSIHFWVTTHQLPLLINCECNSCCKRLRSSTLGSIPSCVRRAFSHSIQGRVSPCVSMHACNGAVFGLAGCHGPDDAQQLYFCTVSWVAFPRPRSTKHSTWGWRGSRGLLGFSGPNPDRPQRWEPYLNTMSSLWTSVIRSLETCCDQSVLVCSASRLHRPCVG